MKILVLSNLYPPDVLGGYELGCRQAVDGLIANGHDVRVLTTTPRQASATPAEPHVVRRLDLHDLWYNAQRPASNPAVNRVWDVDANWVSAHNVHVLLQEVESFQPDVVYVWMILGVGGLGLLGAIQHMALPWVWHLMDEVPSQLCSTNWAVVPGLAKSYNRFFDGRYISCSRSLAERIVRKGIELRSQVDTVPNWVIGDRPPLRETFYRGGTLRIMSAGRVTRDKGMALLVEASKALVDDGYEDFEVDIFGPVVEPAIPEQARKLGLGDRVRFRGSVPQAQLFKMYDEFDLFAFPTESREPFGFAPLEAAARGCVPLMTQVCGIGEWLVHDVHCLKTARTVGAFAEAIAKVIRGEVDLATIGARAQKVVLRDFHRDAILPRIERILREAADAPRPRAAGTAEDAHRMALIAERLSHAIVQEPFCG